jgi:hypothetical protein
LAYALAPTRESAYSVEVDGIRTDHQGVRATDPSTAVTFVPRTTQTHFSAIIRGDHTGRRNLLGWELRGTLDDFQEPKTPAGFVPPPTCLTDIDCDDGNSCTLDSCIAATCQYARNSNCDLQNSTSAGARGSWRYQLTERSAIGLAVDVEAIMYDVLPTAYVEMLGIVGAHTFTRAMSMSYTIGGAYTSSGNDNDTNVVGDVTLTRNITNVSNLSAGLRRWVTQGSGVGGVSLDQGGYLAYDYNPRRRGINGSVVAGYWQRDPVPIGASAATASSDTLSATGVVGWNFNQYVSLNGVIAYADQTSSDATLDTRYASYGINLRWSIRGDVRRLEAPSGQQPQQPQQPEPQEPK